MQRLSADSMQRVISLYNIKIDVLFIIVFFSPPFFKINMIIVGYKMLLFFLFCFFFGGGGGRFILFLFFSVIIGRFSSTERLCKNVLFYMESSFYLQ